MKAVRHVHRAPRARSAFTLVELLVALVLVAIGLLALSATTALVVHELGSAAARSAVGMSLRNRVERFMLAPCAVASGDVVSPHGVRETWRTTLAENSASLRDSATLLDRRRTRTIVTEARRLCD